MPREVRRCGRGDSLPHAEAAWVGPGSTERTSGVGGEAGGKGHSEPLDTILLDKAKGQAKRSQCGANSPPILVPHTPARNLAARHSPCNAHCLDTWVSQPPAQRFPTDLRGESGRDGDAEERGKIQPMNEPVSDFFYTVTIQSGPFKIMQIV